MKSGLTASYVSVKLNENSTCKSVCHEINEHRTQIIHTSHIYSYSNSDSMGIEFLLLFYFVLFLLLDLLFRKMMNNINNGQSHLYCARSTPISNRYIRVLCVYDISITFRSVFYLLSQYWFCILNISSFHFMLDFPTPHTRPQFIGGPHFTHFFSSHRKLGANVASEESTIRFWPLFGKHFSFWFCIHCTSI